MKKFKYSLKDLCKNVNSSFIRNSQKLDATQMSANKRVDEIIVVFHKKEHYATEKTDTLNSVDITISKIIWIQHVIYNVF